MVERTTRGLEKCSKVEELSELIHMSVRGGGESFFYLYLFSATFQGCRYIIEQAYFLTEYNARAGIWFSDIHPFSIF